LASIPSSDTFTEVSNVEVILRIFDDDDDDQKGQQRGQQQGQRRSSCLSPPFYLVFLTPRPVCLRKELM
jgi:hypothetical protein